MKNHITRSIVLGATSLALAGWMGAAFANHINVDLTSPDGSYYVYSTATRAELGNVGTIYDVDSYGNYIYANVGSGKIAR